MLGNNLDFIYMTVSGSIVFFVSYRCSILMNDTVKCDGGLYKSLQAWKDHKLHIEHEVLLHYLPF